MTHTGRKKGLGKDYKSTNPKVNGGPGGWHCICCNPYRTEPRKMKKKAHRRLRRTVKNKGYEDV